MIRKMKDTEEEINEVMNIWLKSTCKGHEFIQESYWKNSYEDVKTIYLPQSETFVYEENGIIKAFISIMNSSYIGALFVHINYQQSGIGTKLLQYVKNVFPSMQLSVYKRNNQAVSFYKKNGFKIIGCETVKETNEEEYIMSNEL